MHLDVFFGPFSNWIVVEFFLMLSFHRSLYILDMSPLPDMGFANMFSW